MFFSDLRGFTLSHNTLNFPALILWLGTGFTLLSRWYRAEYALIGTLFVAAGAPLTFYDHYFQPWSFWEAFFYTLALLLMAQRRWGWLGLVVLLAALNRETGVLILPAFVLTVLMGQKVFPLRAWQWKHGGWLILYTLLWGGVFLALRMLRPAAEHVETLERIWRFNTQPMHLFKAGVNWILFLGDSGTAGLPPRALVPSTGSMGAGLPPVANYGVGLLAGSTHPSAARLCLCGVGTGGVPRRSHPPSITISSA